ncbi:helix-turn-helix domain-containing protein [Leuconostoc sp. MS02]|uniref:Helix-turn-helix domain-containing protein n=1 Tax=Leuconostoc aquikimchii TaxID=3236804 RepID=A0ABV3S645_9LACO
MKKQQLYMGIMGIYPDIALLDLNVNTSLVSVTMDRDKLEKIRQSRGISANGIANKIGLSRSRYYRWLNYEIDLPMDLLIGIQKLLGLTNAEMQKIFNQSNDELIQKTAMLAYYSLLVSYDNCHVLSHSLLKHKMTTLKNDPYLLLVDYADLCVSYADNDDFQSCEGSFVKVMDSLFLRDMWTTLDIIMLVSMVYMNPPKMMPFLSELYTTICDKATALTCNQKVGFLFDLLCIVTMAENNQLTFEILKKINSFKPMVNDWKMKMLCQLNDTLLNHWQDKKVPVSELECVLIQVRTFDNVNYEQKIVDLVGSYGTLLN